MKTSILSPFFLEDVRKYVEKDLNYEYSWSAKDYVRKRDRGPFNDADFSQKEAPYVTVTEVLDFEDDTYYGGYCETCSYEEIHCKITYRLETGETAVHEYNGSFSTLIEDLVKD